MKSEVMRLEADSFAEGDLRSGRSMVAVRNSCRDYFKFAIYCMLLAVPLYAITISVLKHDWIMVAIDVLIVPVGFVHGLLLLFGYVR